MFQGKGEKVGDPFISPSPTLLVISGHIPTQWDSCTIVIAHEEKYTEIFFIFQEMDTGSSREQRKTSDYIYIYIYMKHLLVLESGLCTPTLKDR